MCNVEKEPALFEHLMCFLVFSQNTDKYPFLFLVGVGVGDRGFQSSFVCVEVSFADNYVHTFVPADT